MSIEPWRAIGSIAKMNSDVKRVLRDDLLKAALDLLGAHGPEALQTRKIATAAGTSTMAVYTHFGGMYGLIAAVATEGLRLFSEALNVPQTPDPVTDLFVTSIAYRRFALERPHLYRLMFGSTSAQRISAPAHNVLALSLSEITAANGSFAQVVHGVHRAMLAGRITAGSADDDAAVVEIAAQIWAAIHGFVMLELAGYYGGDKTAVERVLASMTKNLLVALGDSTEQAEQSQRQALGDS